MAIALIDNADSFSGNIAQYLFEVTGQPPLILPNSTRYAYLPLAQIDAFVLSPGPGRPSREADFGVCAEVIRRAERPILGVCLGHQGINEAFGGRTRLAPMPKHGIVESIKHTGTGLFAGLPPDLPVVRYHSLISTDVPESLQVTAATSDGLVMALAHRELPIWGVQFHPESIASEGGRALLVNFVRLAGLNSEPAATGLDGPKLAGVANVKTPEEPEPVRAFRAVGGPANLVLHVEPLAQSIDPGEVFRRRYAEADQAFWVNAAMGAGGSGSVVLSYSLGDRHLTMTGPQGQRVISGDVFELLDQVISSVDISAPPGWGEKFSGGLIGYFGYELKALNGGDERHRAKTPDAWWLFATDFVAFDHGTGEAFDCHLRPAGHNFEPQPATDLGELKRSSETDTYSPVLVDEADLGLRDDRDTYQGKIVAAQDLITAGESYEICLTNVARRPFVGSGFKVFERMRAVSPVPHAAYLKMGAREVASLSPETFLQVDSAGGITSRPIKGTRRRFDDKDQDAAQVADLAASMKDRAENLMITDLVRHDLNAVCEPGSVQVPSMFAIETYRSVHQMVSTIQGQLSASPLQAVRSCFPPGSMTGAPKIRTMQILDELESAPRGIYSGALGWIGFDGRMDLSVVIRTVVFDGGVATWGVGGAITALSSVRDEFDETLVKAGLAAWALGPTP